MGLGVSRHVVLTLPVGLGVAGHTVLTLRGTGCGWTHSPDPLCGTICVAGHVILTVLGTGCGWECGSDSLWDWVWLGTRS